MAFEDSAIVIDLSSWEAGQSLKPYKDAGATHVILRMGYQGQYMVDHWDLQEDKCWRGWFDEARSLGLGIGGYYLYCAGCDEQDYEHSEVLLDQIHQIMAGGRYRPDFLFIDDEVNKWTANNRTVTATGVNQVKGVKILIDKCWKNFKLVTGHYSRVTFMNQTADYLREYTTWKDNVNKGGMTVPSWYAYYYYFQQTLPGTSLRDIVTKLTLTSTNELKYLQLGSYSLWDLWQFAGDVKTAWGKCDISVSRKPLAEFNADMGITTVTPPPPPPPDDNPDLTAVLAALKAHDERLISLETFRDHVKGA